MSGVTYIIMMEGSIIVTVPAERSPQLVNILQKPEQTSDYRAEGFTPTRTTPDPSAV